MKMLTACRAQWPVVLGLFILGLLVLHSAVICEDAYITFRVIDNFFLGYGWRWNTYERVQVYTHPLWMMLHIPFYAVWSNIYLISILICLTCSAFAVWLALTCFTRDTLAVLCLFLLPLSLSYTFLTYSTSGFENPLTHLLFAWFLWIYCRARTERFWFWLSLSTSLALLNRLDVMIFYAPVWAFLLATRFRDVRWQHIAAGMLPLLAWEMFSLFYYGFLFPNTKYAKLNTGIETMQFVRLGVLYLLNLLAADIVSALMLLVTVLLLPFLFLRYRRTRDAFTGFLLAIACGSTLYTCYIVYAGGTYLTGRFVSLQVFAAAWIMLALAEPVDIRKQYVWVLAMVVCYAAVPSPEWIIKRCPLCFQGVGFNSKESDIFLTSYLLGLQKLPQPRSMTFWTPVPAGSVGQWGFMMKRDIQIIDYIGIADPLLARMPSYVTHLESTGILMRPVPEGYVHAVKTGDTSKMDPDLAAYWDKLHLIVSGDLWSSGRMAEIVRFNLGAYDHYRDAYLEKQKLKSQQAKN